MTVSGFTMHRAERQLGQTLESRPKRVGRKIAIADDGVGARAAAQEADDGVPGSPRAERPEFEGSGEGRRAGKRGVTHIPLHPTTPRRKFNALNEHGFLGRDKCKARRAEGA